MIFVDLLERDHIMSKHEHHLLKQCFAQRIFTALQIQDLCILFHTWYPNDLKKLSEHNMRKLCCKDNVEFTYWLLSSMKYKITCG